MQEKLFNFIYNTLIAYVIALALFIWIAFASIIWYGEILHHRVDGDVLILGFVAVSICVFNVFITVHRDFRFEIEQGRWAEYESILLPCIIKGSEIVGALLVFWQLLFSVNNTLMLAAGALIAVAGTAADAIATFVPRFFSMFAPEETLSAMLIQIEFASPLKKNLGAQYLLRFEDEHGKHYSFVTSDSGIPDLDTYISGVLTIRGRRLLHFAPMHKYT